MAETMEKKSKESRRPRAGTGAKTEEKVWAELDADRAERTGASREQKPLPEDVVVGRNAVHEALKSGRGIHKLLFAEGHHAEAFQVLWEEARARGVRIEKVPRQRIETLAAGHRHQGVLAYVAPVPYAELDDILAAASAKGTPPLLLLLDGIEDPHNLGALLRTAEAVGVDGVLLPRRRSCPLSATVAKTSAGAVEYVPVAQVGNVAQAIHRLTEAGFWVAGADMDGRQAHYEADFTGPLTIVIGGEGKGLSRLTKENCDFLVRLPMQGRIQSLNASVAGAVLLYEVFRQRQQTVKAR